MTVVLRSMALLTSTAVPSSYTHLRTVLSALAILASASLNTFTLEMTVPMATSSLDAVYPPSVGTCTVSVTGFSTQYAKSVRPSRGIVLPLKS